LVENPIGSEDCIRLQLVSSLNQLFGDGIKQLLPVVSQFSVKYLHSTRHTADHLGDDIWQIWWTTMS